ncbi:MAG: response regulator, partial [Pseudomonadota bacterium]
DALAFREDLAHAAALLEEESAPIDYLRQFLIGVARVAHDQVLEHRASGLSPQPSGDDRQSLRRLLDERMATVAPV